MPDHTESTSRRADGVMARVVKRSAMLGVVLLIVALLCLLVRAWPRQLRTDELGSVHVYPAWLWQRGMVFMLSDQSGWQKTDADAAAQLARHGYYVVGVDTKELLRQQSSGESCVYLPGELETVSHDLQRNIGTSHYYLPALVGQGAGAALVYMAHLQAPPLAFSAAVAVNPTPRLLFTKPFCDHPAVSLASVSQTLRAEVANADVPLRIWNTPGANEATRKFVLAANQGAGAVDVKPPALPSVYLQALADIATEQQHSGLGDLPLVEVHPAKPTQSALAILYSGDGGWRDLDQTLAGILADKGMPVVGVDVLKYYWQEKSPQQSATDLARIIRHYQQQWHRQPVVLIGFSFGANVLPFLYNRLPADVRQNVSVVSLLSPERTTAFAVDPTAWLHIRRDGGKVAIAPELLKMPAARVQCVYGKDESADSLCTLPEARLTRVLRKPGGHHFDEKYDQLANDILSAVH